MNDILKMQFKDNMLLWSYKGSIFFLKKRKNKYIQKYNALEK